nr:MAG TPA: hypothetical protein [Caudoviricetes sp.]
MVSVILKKSSCLKGWLLYFIEINWYNKDRLY